MSTEMSWYGVQPLMGLFWQQKGPAQYQAGGHASLPSLIGADGYYISTGANTGY